MLSRPIYGIANKLSHVGPRKSSSPALTHWPQRGPHGRRLHMIGANVRLRTFPALLILATLLSSCAARAQTESSADALGALEKVVKACKIKIALDLSRLNLP